MKHELHPNQSALSRALYVIRLRHGPFRSAGRWIRRTVASRRESNEREWALRMKSEPWHPKRWQPDHGRESPREDWMGWRQFGDRYTYPGCVGAKRKMIGMDVRRAFKEYGSVRESRSLYTVRTGRGQ